MRKMLAVTVPEEVLERVNQLMEIRGQTRSAVVTAALGFALGFKPEEIPPPKTGPKPKTEKTAGVNGGLSKGVE
jgi:hypothetical protein